MHEMVPGGLPYKKGGDAVPHRGNGDQRQIRAWNVMRKHHG